MPTTQAKFTNQTAATNAQENDEPGSMGRVVQLCYTPHETAPRVATHEKKQARQHVSAGRDGYTAGGTRTSTARERPLDGPRHALVSCALGDTATCTRASLSDPAPLLLCRGSLLEGDARLKDGPDTARLQY